jgi:hypothetical protein
VLVQLTGESERGYSWEVREWWFKDGGGFRGEGPKVRTQIAGEPQGGLTH